jgi:hypothetical protein
MHVIFLAPHFPANQRQFVRALHQVGAQVTGIGDVPVEALDPQLKSWLSGYEYVRSLVDEDALYDTVRRIQERGPWVHRLEATIESMMLTAARVRERTSIPGISVHSITLCRDKFAMKQELRAQGIPCAQNAAVSRPEQAIQFVEQVGYPVILKPRDGAGAYATYRIDNDEQLKQALHETGLTQRESLFTMEEFIEGHEGFYDTITCNGQVIFDGIAHYYPNVLEAMRTRWISPQIVLTNRMQAEGYQGLRQFGKQVLSAFQLQNTPTHMEWFVGKRGLVFSEIGARPPGCRFWDLYSAANDFDIYVEWARALVTGHCAPQPSRQYAAGVVALRPSEDGHIVGYLGKDAMFRRFGKWIFNCHFPHEGSRTQPVEAGYLANAWVWVRHPNYDMCREILDEIGRTVKVIAR